MEDNSDKIKRLFERLETVLNKQDGLSREVEALRREIAQLKPERTSELVELPPRPVTSTPAPVRPKSAAPPTPPKAKPSPKPQSSGFFKSPDLSRDFEKFVGENLINKIGILITIIGVAIGAKYSIDNNLISPLTRIILGYVVGIGLLGFGMRLKEKYEGYSAVLVSGAMTIMYFITYAAYSFYGLFPQILTFVLMALFTVFTVVAALNYKRQIIAHIGLVGAYAVPFLLSDGSGRVGVLLSYMSIINIGILVIAFKQYWKPLYYVAFVLSWLIFTSWYVMDYEESRHYGLALFFATLFFLTFYGIFLAFKLLQKQQFAKSDIVLLLFNSFIYYGMGYILLAGHKTGEQLLGLFTLANGIIHFAVSVIIYKQQLADRNLFYMVAGLVLIFITMAVPVQLDGNWVTLLWAGEAALLFWIGRSRQVPFYEKLSYPLMLLALFSIFDDWHSSYNMYQVSIPDSYIRPLFNVQFLSSVLFLAAFGFINYFNQNTKYPSYLKKTNSILQLMSFAIPAIFVIVLYGALKAEIENYWTQLFQQSRIYENNDQLNGAAIASNYDLQDFKIMWVLNYTLLFTTILSFINLKKWKNFQLGIFNILFNLLALLAFLSSGLYIISELRESYLDPASNEYFTPGFMHLGIRYISLIFPALLLYVTYLYSKEAFMKYDLRKYFNLVLHLAIVWILSSELLHWMDMAGSTQSYKLGLSILWGIYGLMLVSLGIWKKQKYLRIAGIVLFAITLIKLFLYDISHLDTIAKTVVFVSLGVLLLIVSFLYNKYRNEISGESEKELPE